MPSSSTQTATVAGHSIRPWISSIVNGRLPDSSPSELAALADPEHPFPSAQSRMESLLCAVKARKKATRRGVWGVVAMDWISKAAFEMKKIGAKSSHEPLCGAGFLSLGLSNRGIESSSSDNPSFGWGVEHSRMRRVAPGFKTLDAVLASRQSEADVLCLSWPPNGLPLAFDCANARGAGSVVLAVGSPDMCAEARFWNSIEPVWETFLPGWPMCPERVVLGRWNP